MSYNHNVKIALVHDDFCQAGGAENLFAEIAAIWPQAPIYTSLVNWQKLPPAIDRLRVETSFLQKIPFAAKFFKSLLPLYPLAFESFNFTAFDVVISSSTRFSKSIITSPHTIHICYLNSVPRFLWDHHAKKQYLRQPFIFLLKPFFTWLSRYDLAASSRVDYYIANSQNIRKKIKNFYNRDSEVIYPFIDFNFFKTPKIHNWQLKDQSYFLIVTRLVKWKRVEIAIAAFKKLKLNLKIVGSGPDEERLKNLANGFENIEFLGKVTPKELIDLYQNASYFIVTQEEDFGLSALEAQACGVPVIA